MIGVTAVSYAFFHKGKGSGSFRFSIFSAGVLILISTVLSDGFYWMSVWLGLSEKSAPRILVGLSLSNIFFIFLFAQVLSRLSEIDHSAFSLTVEYEASQLLSKYAVKKRAYYVIIPALNELENLRLLLPRLTQQIDESSTAVLIIDDGSIDGTAELSVQQNVHILSLSQNRGGGTALQIGFRIAQKLGAEAVVTMDADCQHLPEDVPRFIDALNQGQHLVIGSRIKGRADNSSWVRRIGISFFSALISALIRKRITDSSSGFRGIKIGALKSVNVNQPQYHTAELLIRFARKNMRIKEIPIEIAKRSFGSSKKGGDFLYGLNYARVILTSALFEK
jgi:hypothetical protein